MPRVNAARLMAKDKRENKNKRAIKVKVEGDTILNDNELLRLGSIRKKKKTSGLGLLKTM